MFLESCQNSKFKIELKELKKQVKCMPRDTVVDLVTPTGISVRYNKFHFNQLLPLSI